MDPIKPFTSFYDSIGFAPTRQALAHADSHQERRSVLYHSLGIPSIAIRGSRVLEFGPGSGENCQSVLLHEPSHYTMVDGARSVLDGLRERLGDGGGVSLEYAFSDIDQYSDERLYDLVICEGVLPMQWAPKRMANHILRFVRPGGVLVLTCFDSCSAFSELCRRFIAQRMFGKLVYTPELVTELTDFFSPDLRFLPGMSRRPEDWVIDTLINPWVGEFFSLSDALDVARGQAVFLGSSPRFFQDLRWYKDPSNLDRDRNLEVIGSWLNSHSYLFLDRRVMHSSATGDERHMALPALTTRVAEGIKRHWGGGEYSMGEFGEDIDRIADCIRDISDDALASLQSLARWAETGKTDDLQAFRSMWGRAQQFVSLVRTDPRTSE